MPEDTENGSQSAQNWNPRLGATELESVIITLGQLEQSLPFLIGLGQEERRRLAKVGDRTRPFLADAVSTALANPGIVPRSVNLDELRQRSETLGHLGEVRRLTGVLLEKMTDTHIRLASELYGVSRAVYSVMKSPATVPGLLERKQQLGKRFARKKNSLPSEIPDGN